MTEARPLVSVVVPSFNAAAYVDDAIGSVVAQTYGNTEILIADDASTDETREHVRAWEERTPNLRWLGAAVRAGRPSVPRNRALAAATGEYVAFLDADDAWTPCKLEDQVQAMRTHAELVLVYSMLRGFGPGASFSGSGYGLKPWPLGAATDAAALEMANTIPCSSVLARRETLQRLGGFDEDPHLNAVEDYDLWLRASRTGAIGFIPRIHGYYRVHAAGISRDPEVQRQRAEYLVAKRQLQNFTFREFRQRTRAQTLGRNAADVVMTGALRTCEWAGRVAHAPVPLWRRHAPAGENQ